MEKQKGEHLLYPYKRYFWFLFILVIKLLMHVLLVAFPGDIFATEIMRFDYGFTMNMKGQVKLEDAPSLFFQIFRILKECDWGM